MLPSSLPEALVDSELTRECADALDRAKARGVNPIMAAGSILGVAVVAVHQAGGTMRDCLQTAVLAWNALKAKLRE